ncbi:TrkA family potassium uptake protein [Candidatus Woesearchaeota archaeon]|jgi:trk system potassium uptake protein|nr:TrkA family potassium uptake protein [Candidatus Woesearchaeota archaeon]
MKVIISGAGQIGKTIASVLTAEKYDVVIVEIVEDTAKEIANNSTALVIHGDASDMSILKQAGIETCDAIIAATGDDKTNVMICEIAKESEVAKIIARVNTAGNEELFNKMEVSAVSSVSSVVSAIKRNLTDLREEKTILTLGKGDVQVITITVGNNSKAIDMTPAVIKSAIIGAIYRNSDLIIPKPDTQIKEGDLLIITLKSKDLPKIKKLLLGDS